MLLTVKQKIKSMFECKNISVGELLTQSNIFLMQFSKIRIH